MNPRVSRALESGWGLVARAARYLGPLLWDAIKYFWRLLIDTVGGLRILLMSWRARRNPARSADYIEQQTALRARRAARWTPWRELTATRRLEVRAAAAALALIVFVMARASWRDASQPAVSSPNAAQTNTEAGTPASQPPATVVPEVDVRHAVARFAADRQHISPGEWAVLRDVPVLERGPLGAWDDHALAFPVVLKENDARSRYRMWFRGCHLAVREFSCGVGHARSADGAIWEKASGPVFVPQDPSLQESLDEIAVVKAGGRYYLWYSVMADYFNERRRPAVYLATSVDGLRWNDEGQVLEGASENPPTIAHSVLHDGQRFHLWYVTSAKGEGRSPIRMLQHLASPDGKVWTAIGSTSLQEALSATVTPDIGRFTIQEVEGRGFRAYTYSSVLGALTSPDGTAWTKADIGVGPLKDWRKEGLEVQSLSGLLDDEGLWLWMDIRSTQENMRVGVAFRKGG